MKRITSTTSALIAALLLLLGANAGAQPGRFSQQRPDQMRAIESRRVAYLTGQMNLSPEEAMVFWPIYNEYTAKVREQTEEHRAFQESMPPAEEMTREQAMRYVEEEVRRMEKAAELRRRYHEKLLEVIPVTKLALLYDAEKGFNRMLFRQSQQQRHRDRR